VYSWGRNSNFTLGHGDDKERNTPEVVDVFARMLHISIKEVRARNRDNIILEDCNLSLTIKLPGIRQNKQVLIKV
jgi:alpha-tubulin suppressor-like RCC1 family protein